MDLIIGIIMNILATFTDANTVDKDTTVAYSDHTVVNEGGSENKYTNKKLKHYYSEEILCSLADSIWDAEEYDKIINSIKDKDIKLTGTVNRVRDNIDGCYVVFTQKRADGLKDGWAMITCYFDDEYQKEKVMELEKGDKITIMGHCTKYPITGISLYDCYLK